MNFHSVCRCTRILNHVKKACLLSQNISDTIVIKNTNANQFCNSIFVNKRFAATHVATSVPVKKESLITKIVDKIPFIDINKSRAQAAGYLLYETVVDKINYIEFFEKYGLPDTFYSWFVITELHAWMWSTRSMAEGKLGKQIRNFMIEALWADTSLRSKKLGASNPSAIRAQINSLSEQLQASLIAYDEGLQGSDTILAGALWRRFYQQGDVNPLHLDSLVKYIRKQMRALDNIPREILLSKEIADWQPIQTP